MVQSCGGYSKIPRKPQWTTEIPRGNVTITQIELQEVTLENQGPGDTEHWEFNIKDSLECSDVQTNREIQHTLLAESFEKPLVGEILKHIDNGCKNQAE